MKRKAKFNSQFRFRCPHCRSLLRIRTSRTVSPLYRVAYLHCTNDDCGWRGKGEFEIKYTLVPSEQRDPNVQLRAQPTLLQLLLPDID